MSAANSRNECFVCGQALQLNDDLMVGELIDCHACGTEFEVTTTEPLALVEAPSVGEDWGQ